MKLESTKVFPNIIYDLREMDSSLRDEVMQVLISNKEQLNYKDYVKVNGSDIYSLNHLLKNVYGFCFKMPLEDRKSGLVISTMVYHIIVFCDEENYQGAYIIRNIKRYQKDFEKNFELDARDILKWLKWAI